jgi:hypothetical protein
MDPHKCNVNYISLPHFFFATGHLTITKYPTKVQGKTIRHGMSHYGAHHPYLSHRRKQSHGSLESN